MKLSKGNVTFGYEEAEQKRRDAFIELYKNNPIPDNEVLRNLGLFIRRQDLSRILYMNDLYKKIINVHGVVAEFGVRWGQNLALFESFRGIYEPYNLTRKIIGFDTFEGFPSVHEKDGSSENAFVNSMAVTEEYEKYLEQILAYHETESPISHIKKYDLIKGDAITKVEEYLAQHKETIIAFAYLDFDIYEPTKAVLHLIKDRLTKGSVIGFDELNCEGWPGETEALQEVFGLTKYRIERNKYSSSQSFIVIE